MGELIIFPEDPIEIALTNLAKTDQNPGWQGHLLAYLCNELGYNLVNARALLSEGVKSGRLIKTQVDSTFNYSFSSDTPAET